MRDKLTTQQADKQVVKLWAKEQTNVGKFSVWDVAEGKSCLRPCVQLFVSLLSESHQWNNRTHNVYHSEKYFIKYNSVSSIIVKTEPTSDKTIFGYHHTVSRTFARWQLKQHRNFRLGNSKNRFCFTEHSVAIVRSDIFFVTPTTVTVFLPLCISLKFVYFLQNIKIYIIYFRWNFAEVR